MVAWNRYFCFMGRWWMRVEIWEIQRPSFPVSVWCQAVYWNSTWLATMDLMQITTRIQIFTNMHKLFINMRYKHFFYEQHKCSFYLINNLLLKLLYLCPIFVVFIYLVIANRFQISSFIFEMQFLLTLHISVVLILNFT